MDGKLYKKTKKALMKWGVTEKEENARNVLYGVRVRA